MLIFSKKLIEKCYYCTGFQLFDNQFCSFPEVAVRFSLFYGLRKVRFSCHRVLAANVTKNILEPQRLQAMTTTPNAASGKDVDVDEVRFPLEDISSDEISRVLLLRVFERVAPILGGHVRQRLENIFGESAWLRKAGDCLSRHMQSILVGKPHVILQDIYVITEVIMATLDNVFVDQNCEDCLGLKSRSDRLLSMAADVDCIAQTRTCLFHSVQLSVLEVHRCVLAVERLCTRMINCTAGEESRGLGDFLSEGKAKMKVRL